MEYISSLKAAFNVSAGMSSINRAAKVFIYLMILLFPSSGYSMVIESDTIWSGDVSVDQNVLVPAGVTLTISPGTIIRVNLSGGTKTDPEFISAKTEITIRGTLTADGTKELPVTFLSTVNEKSAWAGIIIDGGKAVLRSSIIRDAENGIDVIRGSVFMSDSLLINNRYGLIIQGKDAAVRVETSQVKENDYGVFLLNGGKLDSKDIVIKGNRKKDEYSISAKDYSPILKEYKAQKKEISRVYDDEVFLGTVVWQGRIQVNGIIRVPENSRLIITPGTIVEFSRKDTNNDGIGENGLLIQGSLIAKGTKENPIFFRSDEKKAGISDWDSINILNSDKTQNLIEYCQIENAYRGMHFHFANVAVNESVLRNNSRGIQFQESIVEIRGTQFYDNISALWARDSEIIFNDNFIYHNYSGLNFFRNTLALSGNAIMNNRLEGLRVREGIPVIEGNLIDGNRYGLMVVDTVYGIFNRNVISHNLESGIALRGPANIEIKENIIQGNGINGISIQDSSAVIQGNLISENGERGIGVLSFHGAITGNNIVSNGIYNLGIDGENDVSAAMNWWGEGDVKSTIFDKENDPVKGRADYMPIMGKPANLTWPLKTIRTDTVLQGVIIITESVLVEPGTQLAIMPNTSILFVKGAGLVVKGKIIATGQKNAPITFSSLNGDSAGEWDEIRLEHADGSLFANCIIKNATWGLHLHFTDIKVEGCSFVNNYGGMRFMSGPIEVRHTLFRGNEIGLRSNKGIALITESVITENRIGIFVRAKGGGLNIKKNNLFANTDYNIRIGDFNDEDVNAADNWWGDAIPSDTIFDARVEPEIGTVNYEPAAKKPFVFESASENGLDKVAPLKKDKDGAGKK